MATDSRPHLDHSLLQNEDVYNGEARELEGWQQALLNCADKASGTSFPTMTMGDLFKDYGWGLNGNYLNLDVDDYGHR